MRPRPRPREQREAELPPHTHRCVPHRYDEWVKADRIIWPVEKGTKKRLRKKIKVSSGSHVTRRLGVTPPPV